MFTKHYCPVCSGELSARGIHQWACSPETGEIDLRLTTEPLALALCANGHKSVLQIADPAHALLFERALQRLVTGSTRDAVIDAYTAFEMYLPHVPVRARYDRGHGGSPAELRRSLEFVTKYSERTFGAALAVASLVSGKSPPKLTEKATSLRNKAVHAGHHPTVIETQALCLEIEGLVLEIENLLDTAIAPRKTSYWEATVQEEARAIMKTRGWETFPIAFAVLGTVLGTGRTNYSPRETAIQRIDGYRKDSDDGTAYWRIW